MCKNALTLLTFFTALVFLQSQEKKAFLFLGDSYTAATSEKFENGWPFQLIDFLAKKDMANAEPHIVAGAGWTTEKLLEEIEQIDDKKKFDLVGLMIGVNNQYRGLDVQDFEKDFTLLLKIALEFANAKTERVFIVSIPDWGVTPFAKFKDRSKITKEIATFNEVMKERASANGVTYIDVTKSSRNMGVQTTLIASDSLHPSKKLYKTWGKIIGKKLQKQL